ncbi:MAG: bifunctional phosphoribosyl-AMP cyclohydrolase/phosphoribosyl-ATP diphosphatase HisIE [Marinilabiliales bacterium]|nr:MAG: bifunctional phosphoribosyl-AMP cyclohydrolase/phosphoribosyl-ATP diphosphatase HisIE [Marinilabiliales bacterium]
METDFEKCGGLVPVIVQDSLTKQVLMHAWMNREALDLTKKTGKATFYSRSRKKLWVKGETSGNWLKVVSISTDCDGDTLLLKAEPAGPVCHTGSDTCFGEERNKNIGFLKVLDEVIAQRKRELPDGSYTTTLFRSGVEKIAQKVGEEAVELVIEAVGGRDRELLGEAADLLYHLMVLLRHRGQSLKSVVDVLEERHS